MELGLKDKTALQGKPNPVRKIVRYPDVFAANAKSTLRCFVPALAKKCVFEYLHDQGKLPDRYVCYPKAWWVKPLEMGVKKFGLPECDWREMHFWF